MASSHRILLTGANGFIASHILAQLLTSPSKHSIRAVVRSSSKVAAIQSLFPGISSSQLDYAVVADITVPGAFDSALAPDNGAFDIVMHTASPYLYNAAKSAADFLEPAIKGTTEILSGIQRVCPNSVKRVILTSSFAAIGSFGAYNDSNKVYTEDDWNPVTIERAEDAFAQGNKNPAYGASKKFAEKAAWEFKTQYKEEVSWGLVVINPPMVYGPLAHGCPSLSELNESTARIYDGFLKDKNPNDPLIPEGLPLYADVRDVAMVHVRAMDAPGAVNQRFIVGTGDIRSQEIADILRTELEGVEEKVPKGEPGKNTKPDDAFSADTSKAEQTFQVRWRNKKETFGDLGKQLVRGSQFHGL